MSTTTTLSLANFLQSETQIAEKMNLHNLLFSYILQKHILHHQSSLEEQKNTTLCEFRLFLVENGEQSIQPLTVYYMELLNEFPDWAETMSLVAEDLLSKFSHVQGGWVLLVGDGKSYKHLMTIKKQYSTALRNLLLFPRDRHILKNCQPNLMKVYFAAGLREIAKNSGYQGSTLKSLEQCSNYKRTHYFLLRIWEALYREMLCTYLSVDTTTFMTDVSCIFQSSLNTKKSPMHTMKRICDLVGDTNADQKFKTFIDHMSAIDKTWKLWAQFVFRDFPSQLLRSLFSSEMQQLGIAPSMFEANGQPIHSF